MKNRNLFVCVIIAVLAVAAGLYISTENNYLVNSKSATQELHSPNESIDTITQNSTSISHGNPEPHHLVRSNSYNEYIKNNQNSANAIGSVFLLTRDPAHFALLEKLAETDPQAIPYLILASKFEARDEYHRDDILKAAHLRFPTDSIISALLAASEGRAGNFDHARKLLNSAAEDEAFSLGQKERFRSMREILIASGLPVENAWVEATLRENANSFKLGTMLNDFVGVLNASKKLPQNELMELASSVAKLASRLNPDNDNMDVSSLVALNIERAALKLLPRSTEYDETGITVSQRITEIEKHAAEGPVIQGEVISRLFSEKISVIHKFLEIRESDGNAKALEWYKNIAIRN